MTLRSGDERGKDVGAVREADPRDGGRRRPVAAAFRLVSRLILGIPAFIAAVVVGVCLFGLAAGAGGYAGFMFATNLWSLP